MEDFPTWLAVAAAAIYHCDERMLLQRRPAHKHHGNLWEFPGGKVEKRESPRAALCREIAEELSLRLESASLVPVGFADEGGYDGNPPVLLFLYSARKWSGSVVPAEGQDWGWFTAEAAAELPLAPMDRHLLQKLSP